VFFEEKVKKHIGDRTEGDLFVYNNKEKGSANEVFNILFQEKLLSEQFLSGWIDWYLEKVFNIATIKERGRAIEFLLKTWKRYFRVYKMSCIICENGKRRALEDLAIIFSDGISYKALKESMMKYGVGLSYAYTLTFYGKEEAVKYVYSYLSDINDDLKSNEVQDEYFEIIKATFFHGVPNNKVFLIDDQIKSILVKLNKRMGLKSDLIKREGSDGSLIASELEIFWSDLEKAYG
jgi:hypothetical protein